LNTTRNKRWNGRLETLKADYLSGVIGQMDAYGDRVQFALNGPGQKPLYQVINADGSIGDWNPAGTALTQVSDTNWSGTIRYSRWNAHRIQICPRQLGDGNERC